MIVIGQPEHQNRPDSLMSGRGFVKLPLRSGSFIFNGLYWDYWQGTVSHLAIKKLSFRSTLCNWAATVNQRAKVFLLYLCILYYIHTFAVVHFLKLHSSQHCLHKCILTSPNASLQPRWSYSVLRNITLFVEKLIPYKYIFFNMNAPDFWVKAYIGQYIKRPIFKKRLYNKCSKEDMNIINTFKICF